MGLADQSVTSDGFDCKTDSMTYRTYSIFIPEQNALQHTPALLERGEHLVGTPDGCCGDSIYYWRSINAKAMIVFTNDLGLL